MLRRAATVVGTATLLPLLLAAGPPPDPGHCLVVDGAGQCLVAAADPGRPGGPLSRSPRAPSRRTPAPVDRQAPKAPPAPQTTTVFGLGPGFGGVGQVPNYLLAPIPGPAAGPAPAQPDTAVLTRRAVQLLNLARPALQLSVRDRGYVGVPVWLWIGGDQADTGPIAATAAVGAARVTATARLASTRWEMGPPGATVRCDGPGTPWHGQTGASPDCGYVYQQRSLPDRTGGAGAWTVTATAVWQVTWAGVTAGAPVAGAQQIELTTTRALPVGELQVLVTGGGT